MLNRLVRKTKEGCGVEADQRHCELVIEQMDVAKERVLSTPGSDEAENEKEEGEELQGGQVRQYRATSARLNYLAQDRGDITYPVKEACREIARPTAGSWKRLTRIAQYLKGKPRLVWECCWLLDPTTIDVMGDANWAGCRRKRKSTPGGAMMLGKHRTNIWSKTQALVARSSGESELYEIGRAPCGALGSQTPLKEFGKVMYARVHADATTAKSIRERTGLDRIRHLDFHNLWLQEQHVRERERERESPPPPH